MEAKFDKIYKDIVDTIIEKGIWSEGNVRTKYADGTAAHYKSSFTFTPSCISCSIKFVLSK